MISGDVEVQKNKSINIGLDNLDSMNGIEIKGR